MPLSLARSALATILVAAPVVAQNVPVTERTLSNGLRVLLVERHEQPTIACGWVAKVGSANERPGITGLSHLFEHMMFKGTSTLGTRDAKRDAELNLAQDKVQAEIRQEIDILREKQRRGEIADIADPKVRSLRHQQLVEAFDRLVKEQRDLIVKDEMDKIYTQAGGQGFNANTSEDRTFYLIQMPSNKLELWTWIESDRIKNAVFREFYSERDVVLEERRQGMDATPTGKFEEAFNAMVWEAHPYHWSVIGWPSDISQVTREQADAHFKTYYAPGNLTAILVGDFKTDEAAALMERYFGRIPANPASVPPLVTTEPKQVAEQRMVAEADTTPELRVVFKGVPSVHKDEPALTVLGVALSGDSGRLNKELVLKQKVATSASAGNGSQKYAGTFSFYVTPVKEKSPEDVESLVYAEIEKLQKDGISDYELQRVKNQVEAYSYRRTEQNMGLLYQLAESESSGTYKDFQAQIARLQAVTREDVQRVAKQYLTKESRNVLIYHRKQEAK